MKKGISNQWEENNFNIVFLKTLQMSLTPFSLSTIQLKITLLILIGDLKSLQSVYIDKFSDMSSVFKSFQLNLDLSTHLTPIHPNAL